MNRKIITLPSNVISSNGTNTMAKFTTELPSSLSFGRNWKVGLVEISYTKSWYNIKTPQPIHITDSDGGIMVCEKQLEKGMYETESVLIEAINQCVASPRKYLESNFKRVRTRLYDKTRLDPKPSEHYEELKFTKIPKVVLNPFNHRASLLAGKRRDGVNVYLSLGKELEEMLGVSSIHSHYKMDLPSPNSLVSIKSKSIKGTEGSFRAYDLKAGIHSLYVYTNLIAPVLVGDSYSQLLRVVQISDSVKFGQQAGSIYKSPTIFLWLNLSLIQLK